MKRAILPFSNGTVGLRLLEKRDLPLTLAWRNRDEVRCCFKYSAILTEEQHFGWFDKYLQKDDDFVFVVEIDNRVVGQASVYGIDWHEKSAEIGRFLSDPELSGKGNIRSACQQLIDMCWQVLCLKYLYLEVFEHNARAVRLYQSLGFELESNEKGLLRMGLRCGR